MKQLMTLLSGLVVALVISSPVLAADHAKSEAQMEQNQVKQEQMKQEQQKNRNQNQQKQSTQGSEAAGPMDSKGAAGGQKGDGSGKGH